MARKAAKDWACMECGKAYTLKGAERASSVGCAKCGGVDIELLAEDERPSCLTGLERVRVVELHHREPNLTEAERLELRGYEARMKGAA